MNGEYPMKRENLPLWIAALAFAGVGWLMCVGAWCCEINPWGLVSSIIPENVGLATSVTVLRHGCELAVFAALILISTGLLAEASAFRPTVRKLDTVRRSEARV
jgi:hypothetical protein